jgi:hypothetical protein
VEIKKEMVPLEIELVYSVLDQMHKDLKFGHDAEAERHINFRVSDLFLELFSYEEIVRIHKDFHGED